jgi:ribosomal protein S18 acetylase RimI-like enzyme
MSNDLNSLYRLNKADIKTASEVVARSFIEAGDYSEFSDDPAKRMKYLTKIVIMAYNHSLKYGEVYATSKNFEGFAAWLPYDKSLIPIWQYILYGMLPVIIGIGKEARKRLTHFDNISKKKHKEHANFPHWYLYNLAVDPKHQGKGWASALLNPMLARSDREKLPCYLETGDRNVSFYEHFGFEVLEHITVVEYDEDVYVMMRFAR